MNILISHLAGLGDLVVCLPALRVVSEAARPHPVTFVADEAYRQVVAMEGLGFDLRPAAELPWRALWDTSVDPAAAGIGRYDLCSEIWHMGQRRKRYEQATGGQYVDWPPDPGTCREGNLLERTWRWACRAWRRRVPYREPHLMPPAENRADVAAYLAGRGVHAPYVVVAPGAGAQYKSWPEASWWDVCRRLRRSAGLQVVVALGPRECGRGMVAPPDVADFVIREWSVADVAAVVADAALYLGNDSGISHVAAWTDAGGGRRVPYVTAFARLNVATWAARVPWCFCLPMSCATPGHLGVDAMYAAALRAIQS